mmetsp:Transcript_75715/g.219909  ORF Transcript_75715/g.219909 Transcript_75715/m.219909 type:complete len:201 (-) Transcript_75715:247-849(-)
MRAVDGARPREHAVQGRRGPAELRKDLEVHVIATLRQPRLIRQALDVIYAEARRHQHLEHAPAEDGDVRNDLHLQAIQADQANRVRKGSGHLRGPWPCRRARRRGLRLAAAGVVGGGGAREEQRRQVHTRCAGNLDVLKVFVPDAYGHRQGCRAEGLDEFEGDGEAAQLVLQADPARARAVPASGSPARIALETLERPEG